MYFIICACIFLLFSNWIMVKDLFNLVDTASVLCYEIWSVVSLFYNRQLVYVFIFCYKLVWQGNNCVFSLQMNVFTSQ